MISSSQRSGQVQPEGGFGELGGSRAAPIAENCKAPGLDPTVDPEAVVKAPSGNMPVTGPGSTGI